MTKIVLFTALLLSLTSELYAFCGFYVAKADTQLYNKASQVVMVRDEDRTVISMMNDYEGPLKNFALVVPVPSVLKKDQVHVTDRKYFSRIDSFTAPRLVEYFDSDPCQIRMYKEAVMDDRAASLGASGGAQQKAKSLGVKVEEQFTVGEYDIVILSAKESNGLEIWLRQNGYSIPKGAHQALAPYIKQKLKFFVAKVNLKEQIKTGLSYLRPLQFAFESEKFMLPLRLGMINSKGPQELFVFMLTKKGRVETTNYQTVKLPTDLEIPVYIKDDFSHFYTSLFDQQVKKEKMKAVFTEYFWDMSWCDPCAAEPLTKDELRELGVFWVDEADSSRNKSWQGGGSQPVKVTRLHLRYTKETFPDDLVFHQTNDTQNFQGRYILRHPWKGERKSCEAAQNYYENLPKLLDQRAQNLAHLTGWDIQDIRKKMDLKKVEKPKDKGSWWQRLWKKEEG